LSGLYTSYGALFFFKKKINDLLHGARRQTVVSTKHLLRYTNKENKEKKKERVEKERK